MPHRTTLSAIPQTHASFIDPKQTAAPNKLEKPKIHGTSQFQLYRFFKDGKILADESGRTRFALLPSSAQAYADAIGAELKRV